LKKLNQCLIEINMRIKYFIEYNNRVFAYRATGKLVPLTKESYGKTHSIVEVPSEIKDNVRKMYPEVSYRNINDDRIPKYIKNKVKYFEGPFHYTSEDAKLLLGEYKENVTLRIALDAVGDDLLNKKKEKMRKLIVSKIANSREFIESQNSWQVSQTVISFHQGKIQALKELLETTD
jgi:hypothetical protein